MKTKHCTHLLVY